MLVVRIRARREDSALDLLKESPWLVSAAPPDEASPLHWAAYSGCARVARRLIRLGADLDALDPEFASPPVGWANEGGKQELIDLIRAHGAEIDISRAAAAGLEDRVRLLVEGGTSLDDDAPSDWLPLAQAAGWGRVSIVRYLLDAGAPVDGRSEGGVTALHAAIAWSGHTDSVRLLLEAGADPDCEDDRGVTPRQLAVEAGIPAISELLA